MPQTHPTFNYFFFLNIQSKSFFLFTLQKTFTFRWECSQKKNVTTTTAEKLTAMDICEDKRGGGRCSKLIKQPYGR